MCKIMARSYIDYIRHMFCTYELIINYISNQYANDDQIDQYANDDKIAVRSNLLTMEQGLFILVHTSPLPLSAPFACFSCNICYLPLNHDLTR